jgi:purine-binding chemotaxis protein CheW
VSADARTANAGWEGFARRAGEQRFGAAGDAQESRGRGAVSALRQWVGVRLENELYALPIESLREVVRLRPITPMPRVPDHVLGIIALRGEMIQVIDLRRCLGLPAAQPRSGARIVVLRDRDDRAAALLVDAVTGVLRVPESDLRPPPGGESSKSVAVCRYRDVFVSLLDLDRVLGRDAA